MKREMFPLSDFIKWCVTMENIISVNGFIQLHYGLENKFRSNTGSQGKQKHCRERDVL